MTPSHRPSAIDDAPGFGGLQAQRTGLAWSRTAFGITGNAALLSIRELHITRPGLAVFPVVLAILIALAAALYGRRRDATLRQRPLPRPLAARWALITLGIAVITLALVSGLSLLV